MVKASVILFLIVASVFAVRPVGADSIEFEDEEEYQTGFGLGEAEYFDGIWDQGIDLANELIKPPQVECTLTCNNVESDLMFVCSLLGSSARRVGCMAAVGAGAAVCRYYCSTR